MFISVFTNWSKNLQRCEATFSFNDLGDNMISVHDQCLFITVKQTCQSIRIQLLLSSSLIDMSASPITPWQDQLCLFKQPLSYNPTPHPHSFSLVASASTLFPVDNRRVFNCSFWPNLPRRAFLAIWGALSDQIFLSKFFTREPISFILYGDEAAIILEAAMSSSKRLAFDHWMYCSLQVYFWLSTPPQAVKTRNMPATTGKYHHWQNQQ